MTIDPRQETGIAVLAAIIIMMLVGLLALSSCTVKERVVTEYVTIHDTIRTHKTDTLREVSYQVRVDTMRQRETHTITLNNVGDTIREIHHYHDSEKVIVVDSTDRYKATVDSLRAALAREQSKTKTTARRVPLTSIAKWLVIALLVMGAFIAVLKSKTTP